MQLRILCDKNCGEDTRRRQEIKRKLSSSDNSFPFTFALPSSLRVRKTAKEKCYILNNSAPAA